MAPNSLPESENTTTPEPLRLNQATDLRYLLDEFYSLYRRIAAGGSPKIRCHQRAVREAIGRVVKANPEVNIRPADRLPVTEHLRRSIDRAMSGQMESMIRALDAVRDLLSWEYGYEKIPLFDLGYFIGLC